MMMINEAEHKPVEKFSFGWNKKKESYLKKDRILTNRIFLNGIHVFWRDKPVEKFILGGNKQGILSE